MATTTIQRDGASNYANVIDYTPGNPAANATTSLVFAGLALSFTPHKFDGLNSPDTTSSIKIKATMDAKNNTSGSGVQVQILYGTGSAPTNGTAAPGSSIGQLGKTRQGTSSAANVVFEPVIDTTAKSLFTLGTVYWIDLAFAATTSGTATLTNIEFIIEEI